LLKGDFQKVLLWHQGVEESFPDHSAHRDRNFIGCFARTLEATGRLQRAITLYEQLGQDEHVARLSRYISGRSHWVQDDQLIISDHIVALRMDECRLMADGSLVYFRTGFTTDAVQTMLLYRMRSKEFSCEHEALDLPSGQSWLHVQVVKNSPSEPLLVIALPPGPPNRKIEVWQYENSSVWRRIETRGERPQRKHVATGDETFGDCVLGNCVLIGGTELLLFKTTRDADQASFFYVLSLETKIWRRLRIRGDERMSILSALSIDNSTVFLLREGKPVLNEKAGNEVVAKVSVDALEKTTNQYRVGNATKCGDGGFCKTWKRVIGVDTSTLMMLASKQFKSVRC